MIGWNTLNAISTSRHRTSHSRGKFIVYRSIGGMQGCWWHCCDRMFRPRNVQAPVLGTENPGTLISSWMYHTGEHSSSLRSQLFPTFSVYRLCIHVCNVVSLSRVNRLRHDVSPHGLPLERVPALHSTMFRRRNMGSRDSSNFALNLCWC